MSEIRQASKSIVDNAEIQRRILTFVNVANWVLFAVLVVGGMLLAGSKIFLGILFGGLIVTVNFHLLARTLKHSLTPPFLKSHNSILAKYYVRFTISGLIIFVLISEHIVHPIGLFIGLSVVVASIMLATVCEITKLFCCKEAV
ncbi:ATP synthase subunit I [Desulfatirhabdium butyrativorans]|uniref:ATP synthase subunit I n=1 Tax=Desulfatirhabdium butyrativorans TaxID=340467 RepID=UPI000406D36B|nr:ATP synthase subunit I [Desulfatirhabdium butyrativorans]